MSETFSEVLACAQAILGILMCSELFWKTPECSEVLYYVAGRSEDFMWVLKGLSKSLIRSLTFWSVLTHSETFSWFLNSFERFRYVLRHCMKFWGVVLMGFEQFWNNPECYEMFFDVLRSKEFLMVLRRSLTFWDVLWRSDASSWIETLSDISGVFWGGLGRFINSEHFWKIPQHSNAFSDILEWSELFLLVLNGS